ncbi:MAG: hypothetical protein N2320_06575, partial [Candidatus Bipolaricaulota bacterium]|nr:hypothetical protein [Candidatus Bipolaricaulota bacterium]
PDLATFFRDKKKQAQTEDRRQQEARDQWLADLRALLDQLKTWLEPATQEGLMVEEYDHTVREGLLGTYNAPALKLSFGTTETHIVPVARYVVGGTGRVDVEFPGGRILLIRQGVEGQWMVVPEDRIGKKPLNEETFSEIVQEAFS